MGRKKKSGPPPKFATSYDWHKHHIFLFDDLLDSPAFLALSHHARSLYIHLYQKYTGPYSGNNIICTYSELEKKGFRRSTTAKALRMLFHFGFISYESGGLEHQPNVYHLEEGWKKIFTQEDVDRAMKAYKDELALKEAGSIQKKVFTSS